MRFLVDMPLSPALAQWLNGQGHDAVHAGSIGLDRAADTDIIALAARERRTVVTADLDYPRLLALARSVEPGLLLFRGGDWSDVEIIARIQQVLRLLSQRDMERSIVVIDCNRIRRRSLPIE